MFKVNGFATIGGCSLLVPIEIDRELYFFLPFEISRVPIVYSESHD